MKKSGSEELVLSFEPRTIEHLGVQMYSHLPNAVAELVANAYDADATLVRVVIRSANNSQEIDVIDNGHGMSSSDVAHKYLRIGRNRRLAEGGAISEGLRRPVSGKKGVGKLALFGIGHEIRLLTKRAGVAEALRFNLIWKEMMESEGEYHPESEVVSGLVEEHGTTITLADLRRSSKVSPEDLAKSLSRLFNYFDDGFRLGVEGPNGVSISVTRSIRYEVEDFDKVWKIEDQGNDLVPEYLREHGVSGQIFAANKPLRQAMRGITVFVNGRLANEPEYFGAAESSFAFSYLTGYLNLDYLDEIVPDVIATDRRAINWDAEPTAELRPHLVSLMNGISRDWRAYRSKNQRRRTQERVNKNFDEWADSIKGPEASALSEALETVVSPDADIPEDIQDRIIQNLEVIVPQFADLLWRHLHPSIQDAASADYKAGRYFHAVDEALKRYITETEQVAKTGSTDAYGIMTKAFGDSGSLSVFKKYSSIAENHITGSTHKNVENGQKYMSMGLITGVRNTLAHQEKELLNSCGAFTHEDCLDALSILSHLRRRLEDAVTNSP